VGFFDWIKDRFDGDKPAPAPAQPKVLGPTVPKAAPFPGLDAQPSWARTAGAPAPKTWTPAATGNAPSGVPRAISQAMGPTFESSLQSLSKPTPAEYQIMSALGWKMPEGAAPQPEDAGYKTEDPRDLVAFTYMPEKEEVQRIEEVYRGMPGYTAPDESSRKKNPPPMFGSQGVLPQEPELKETPVTTEYQSAALTWDEYDRLSDDQRKAVDFNTLLVRAREADLSVSHATDETQRKTYETDVKAIFGEQGGSEKYAPNTVALLKQIDFTAVGQDLDEYLSLERAFTADEVKKFSLEDVPELKQLGQGGVNYEGARQRTNVEAAEVTAVTKSADAIAKAMTDANVVLDSFYATMEQARLPITGTYGGKALTVETPELGFPVKGQTYDLTDETQAKAAFFTDAYALAASGQMDRVWEQLSKHGATDADVQELFSYLDTRSQQEQRWGRPEGLLVDTAELNYLSPEKTRASIGLGG
jgi:hypothetical protein